MKSWEIREGHTYSNGKSGLERKERYVRRIKSTPGFADSVEYILCYCGGEVVSEHPTVVTRPSFARWAKEDTT